VADLVDASRRIQTQQFEGAEFDMGPACFWRGQPRIAVQVKRFGLAVLEQYSTGLQTVEDGWIERLDETLG
jgi:monoamine oxidase